MPRMIDLIRHSQFPPNLMRAAACGALLVPPDEMMEILVHLALHNKVFGEQARLTLAGWDEKVSRSVVADPATSREVLRYLLAPKNLRPALLPGLLENPSVGEEELAEVAASGSREAVEVLLASERVRKSPLLRDALRSNPRLRASEMEAITKVAEPVEIPKPESPADAVDDAEAAMAPDAGETPEFADEAVLAEALANYIRENEAELAADPTQPFHPIGNLHEDDGGAEAEPQTTAAPPLAHTKPESQLAKPVAAATTRKPVHGHEERRDTTLQKIAKLDVKGRIALAIRGNKEERSILIRDGTKLVAQAVLESPKLSDVEVENIAQQKNVLEAVLRAIPLKRRFAKNYAVIRNLVFNPRTPLDLSLGLMKNLLIHDLKNLSANKEVADTIRKLALRMFKQKREQKG
jgi:hypothetical protein